MITRLKIHVITSPILKTFELTSLKRLPFRTRQSLGIVLTFPVS